MRQPLQTPPIQLVQPYIQTSAPPLPPSSSINSMNLENELLFIDMLNFGNNQTMMDHSVLNMILTMMATTRSPSYDFTL